MADQGDRIAMLELVWRQAQEYTLDWVDKASFSSQSDSFEVEFRFDVALDDTKRRSKALGAMRNDDLSDIIAESTAMALELRWVQGDTLPCPIHVSKLQTLSGLRVRAK